MIRPQVRSHIRPPILPQRQVLAQAVSRYFTGLDAIAAQYYEFPSPVTVTRVVITVYSTTGDSTGLPGSPVITPGVLQTLDYNTHGTLDYIGRVGTSYFDGIIADVQLYNGVDLVADFPFDQQVPVDGIIPNRATANPGAPSHAVAINLLPSDSFEMRWSTNQWESDQLWRVSDVSVEGIDSSSIIVSTDSVQITGNANTSLIVGLGSIHISTVLESASDPIQAVRVRCGIGIAPNTDYLDFGFDSIGPIKSEFLADSGAVLWFKTNYSPGSPNTCLLSSISVTKILRVAS